MEASDEVDRVDQRAGGFRLRLSAGGVPGPSCRSRQRSATFNVNRAFPSGR